jgi:uncharacterized protein YjeT (DUF2065 family)
MQYLATLIFSLFGYGIVALAKRALVAVGFGLVTSFGVYALLDQIKSQLLTQINSLPAEALAMIGLMQIDVCITIILSATTAKLALKGWDKILDSRKYRDWVT